MDRAQSHQDLLVQIEALLQATHNPPAKLTVAKAQEQFVTELNKKLRAMLSTQVDGEFSSMVFSPGFNFHTQIGGNGYFNEKALKKIDYPVLVPKNDISTLDASNSFSSIYLNLLRETTYVLSRADNAKVQKAVSDESDQAITLINEWEQTMNGGGSIDLAGTGYKTKLLYILNQVKEKFPNDTDWPTVGLEISYNTWRDAAIVGLTIQRAQLAAQARLQKAMKNVIEPSGDNGGLQVGQSKYKVGYDNIPSPSDLNNRINSSHNSVSVECFISHTEGSQSTFSIGAGVSVPIPLEFVSIDVGGSAKFQIDQMTRQTQGMTISLTYNGVTPISPSPRLLSNNGATGWYDKQIISQIYKNGASADVTGYKLVSDEWKSQELFGEGGIFSRPRTLVLSQRPAVKMTFHKAQESQVRTMFKESMKVKLNLFDLIPLGEIEQTYSIENFVADSSSGDITVTFGPDEIVTTVSTEDQTCYIMGAVIDHPPFA